MYRLIWEYKFIFKIKIHHSKISRRNWGIKGETKEIHIISEISIVGENFIMTQVYAFYRWECLMNVVMILLLQMKKLTHIRRPRHHKSSQRLKNAHHMADTGCFKHIISFFLYLDRRRLDSLYLQSCGEPFMEQ